VAAFDGAEAGWTELGLGVAVHVGSSPSVMRGYLVVDRVLAMIVAVISVAGCGNGERVR
jgi:hypothetical protein